MDRITKLVVLVWAAAALALEVWLLRGAWPTLRLLAPVAFCGTAALTALDRRAVAIVLAIAYVLPALMYRYLGPYHWAYSAFWMVLLLGAIAPDAIRTPWHLPSRWRGALICWALVVMVGACIVAAREIDFTPALFHVTTVSNTAGGGWPAFIIMWVLHVALVLLMGILWFDWVLGLPAGRFHALVATPLAASALALGLVAIYQLFVDMSFLNATVYQFLGRASGTVFDSNICGTLAALWIGGSVLWAQPFGRLRPYLTAGGMLVCWLAVWATGSRTAFAASALVTCFVLWSIYVASRQRAWRIAIVRVAVGATALVGLLFFLTTSHLTAVGPLARFRATLPSLSIGGVHGFIGEQLWNRGRYGPASTFMIREHPVFGVGVGSFHSLLPEFAERAGGPLPPDNAQNWYRHQVAELGVVGSLPWIAWLIGFGVFVLRRRADDPAMAWTARGVLIAFAAISFVGMPGQDVMVAITFWTMAAWYVSLVGRPPDAPLKPASWAVVGVIVLIVGVYGVGTVYAATHSLRVPVRAMRGGWPYVYGFYPPSENSADGYRWTGRRSVAVVEAPARWMQLTFSVDYRALAGSEELPRSQTATRPVSVRIWRNRELVVEKQLTTTAPFTTWLSVPDGNRWVLIETWVSRVLKPREFGVDDDRELGLRIKWRFGEGPASTIIPAVPR